MKTLSIVLLCMIAACASESPKESTREQNLCTVDDPDCGPPGWDPVMGTRTETYSDAVSVGASPSDASNRISCFATSQHVNCSIGFWTTTFSGVRQCVYLYVEWDDATGFRSDWYSTSSTSICD